MKKIISVAGSLILAAVITSTVYASGMMGMMNSGGNCAGSMGGGHQGDQMSGQMGDQMNGQMGGQMNGQQMNDQNSGHTM